MADILENRLGLHLKKGESYIVIDAMYLTAIKDDDKNSTYSFEQIRGKIFPYLDTPFAEYIPKEDLLVYSNIKSVNYEEVSEDATAFFTTDCGIVLFLNKNIFWDFIVGYDFEKLIDSEIEELNFSYWAKLTSGYDQSDIDILTSHESEDTELDGSGTYVIL